MNRHSFANAATTQGRGTLVYMRHLLSEYPSDEHRVGGGAVIHPQIPAQVVATPGRLARAAGHPYAQLPGIPRMQGKEDGRAGVVWKPEPLLI